MKHYASHHKHQLANHIEVARDGVEALNFIFATGDYTHRSIEDHPRVILLDLKLPRVNVWIVFTTHPGGTRGTRELISYRYNDLIPGRTRDMPLRGITLASTGTSSSRQTLRNSLLWSVMVGISW